MPNPSSSYVNYLGTSDPTIRPPTPAEQAATAARIRQQEEDAQRARDQAYARQQADRDRTYAQTTAAQTRQDQLTREANAAAEERRRQEELRQQQLADRADSRTYASQLMGGNFGGGGSMDALGSVASGGTFSSGGAPGGAPGGFNAPSIQTVQADEEGDRAARTAAKERAGLRLQASMKGLDQEMAGRGIRSSGIQSRRSGELYAASSSDEAQSERDRLDLMAGRRAAIGDRNQDATNQWAAAQLDAGERDADRRARLASEQSNIAMTLLNYGMRY
jgi:hypothetical protein